MINKKFSIHDAYSQGVKTVTNNFGFFVVSLLLAGCSAVAVLSILVGFDYLMLREHFEAVVNLASEGMNNSMGIVKISGVSIGESMRTYLPVALAQHVAPQEVVSVDISHQDIMSALKIFLPVALFFKLFLEIIAIGWTKIALDIQANKHVDYDYLYKFYALAPRVVAVELIKGIATLIGMVLFVVPGVFIFQRLRFAKYFVIDKNQSVMQAFHSSWNLTEGSVLHLVGFSMFTAILMALGKFFFPAMFFLAPLGFQADANVYRQMVK